MHGVWLHDDTLHGDRRVTKPGPEGAGALALVIDDEPLVREQIAALLEQFNYQVVLACDGLDALTKVAIYGQRLRLVTSDFRMPGTDGIDLVRTLRRLLARDVTIVVISGLIDDEEIQALLEIGVDHVLRKPFDRSALARAITPKPRA